MSEGEQTHVTREALEAGAAAWTPPSVWLVVYDVGGLAAATLDEEAAHRRARAANGVVVQVPVVADYRQAEAE